MSFERPLRIAALWNWLPAFRAAAEYESLQRAALAQSVSPSALSRTIKLLEEAVGAALFLRSSTGLSLTPTGETLLRATRDAMRGIDDALGPLAAGGPSLMAVAAVEPFLPSVLAGAFARAPELAQLALRTVGATEVADALLRGTVDLVLAASEEEDPSLLCQPLPPLRFVVAAVDGAQVGATVLAPLGVPLPPGLQQQRVDGFDALLVVARATRRPAVLPEVLLPQDFRVQQRLERTVPLWAISRKPLTSGPDAAREALIGAVQQVLDGTSAR